MILVLNAGSSSLKWSSFEQGGREAVRSGVVRWSGHQDPAAEIGTHLRDVGPFEAVGHRVVHGGRTFQSSVRIDANVRTALEGLAPLAPLHAPVALAGMAAVAQVAPSTPQVAVFDTAFHATIPSEMATYAIPWTWSETLGIRRFGFHGLSVAWSVRRVRELFGAMPSRVIVCHLGGGCSVTAVADGRSIDTTMGFTPLEGVMMGTRSGSIDPGIVFYLARSKNLTLDEIEAGLEHESGLLGVSGVSGDLREVLAAAQRGSSRASLAYALFVHSVRRSVGAMLASLDGLDALVFTGGIGEHEVQVRRDVCASLGFAGLRIDPDRNAKAANGEDSELTARLEGSGVRTFVIHSREDVIVRDEVIRVLGTPLERPRGEP